MASPTAVGGGTGWGPSSPRGSGVNERHPGFMAYLSGRRERIEKELARHVETWRGTTPDRLCDAMAYSLLAGGKRLRPVLALAAFDACGGSGVDEAVALSFASAMECIHTYSLIHDDLPAMDDDDFRRGRPTCHKVYGEATAILAGDALLTEAFAIVAGGSEPARLPLTALLARAAGASGMVGGQQLDLELTGARTVDGPLPELPVIENVHRLKTGALLAAATEGGAIAARADKEQVRRLRTYGQALGLAFQIADDILDVVGDPEKMGKSGRGDEEKGKPTYPALVGLEKARALARAARDAAVEAVADLGERSQHLRALADFAIERAS